LVRFLDKVLSIIKSNSKVLSNEWTCNTKS
jgi:hypothetical protein